jgi:hypothetical protein
MTLKLLLVAAALLVMSACEVRPYGEGPGYYANDRSRADDRDRGNREYQGGQESQEHRGER